MIHFSSRTEDFGSTCQLTISFEVEFYYTPDHYGYVDCLPYRQPGYMEQSNLRVTHVESVNSDGSVAYHLRESDIEDGWLQDLEILVSEWVEEHIDIFYEELA